MNFLDVGNYESMATPKTHSERFDMKVTPERFGEGRKLNTQAYDKCLEVVALRYVKRAASGRHHVWQHDSAPYYTNKTTQSKL